MTKFSTGRANLKLVSSRNWMFDIEPYSRMPQQTFADVNDDLRLRTHSIEIVKFKHANPTEFKFLKNINSKRELNDSPYHRPP